MAFNRLVNLYTKLLITSSTGMLILRTGLPKPAVIFLTTTQKSIPGINRF